MSRLAPVTPWSHPLPPAAPPAGLRLHQLPTGTMRTPAPLAVQGRRWGDVRHFVATAVLVQHPSGDLLVDAGFGERTGEHVRMLARRERAPYQRGRTAREQLDAAGYDLGRLLGVVVTHAHWDHVSGLDSLDVPVWMNADELEYAAHDPQAAVFRAVTQRREIHEYVLDGPEYLGFPASLDVHGDGSVVIARAGGHTPGSVVVFVALPSGERYAFIGDLTWQLEGIERGVERPWLTRRVFDVDETLVRTYLERSIALRDVLHVVPAHDGAAFGTIPLLGPGTVQD